MTVFLVGAGPGDPGLITVRGAEVLARADVVVHDRLIAVELLDLAPPGAERIDVGKEPGGPVDQESVNRLLVERGRGGATVVRLKGGDPFVFGRGGEEALALAAASVPFEIVPGISSALAAPAYAGIPVTHRGLAGAVTVITGHSGGPEDWDALVRVGGTIVVLMGVAQRARIAAGLMAAGLDPTTPVAAVRWGTRPDQRAVRATLAELAAIALEAPVTLVIGSVAGLDLTWFEHRPLAGSRVAVTRASGRSTELASRLSDAGAEVFEVPLIRIADPPDGGAGLRAATADAAHLAWVAFTSATAVERFFDEVHDARSLGGVGVAAVGSATDEALAAHGVRADLVGSAGGGGLAAAFPDPPSQGRNVVLLPRAEDADPALPAGLQAKGWEVRETVAYRTVPVALDSERVAALAGADAVVLSSGSAARALVDAVAGRPFMARIVCIGPTTADAARRAGLHVAAVAERPDAETVTTAVLDAVVGVLGSRP